MNAIRVVVIAVATACGIADAAPHADAWQPAEIVSFSDFDELVVSLNGKPRKAFLVGLRPIRESIEDREDQERVRISAEAQLKKAKVSAQIVTERGEFVGLSIDSGPGPSAAFDHAWDPAKHPYCWSGWGMYNHNASFLCDGTAEFEDNFGDNDAWRKQFADVQKKIAEWQNR